MARAGSKVAANFVGCAEIEAYLQRCAGEFGLDPHITLNTRILSAHYQPSGQWLLHTDTGESELFDVVINAMGNQHTAVFPNLENMDRFTGQSWHSTEWRHDVDVTGKRVVIVGSAASAVQIVPELAPVVKHLTILQRSPNWILPRNKKHYSDFTRSLFNRAPVLMRLLRWGQGKLMQLMHKGALNNSRQMNTFENMGRKHIARTVDDPALRAALTPDSRFGCKRPLVADDFYPALNRDNVTLIAEGAKQLTSDSIITTQGKHIKADVIIYCTGYRVMDFDRIDVVGSNDQRLATVMTQAPEAYKSISVPDFPNYFFGMGPNGVVLSVSYFISAETNVRCIVKLLADMRAKGVSTVDVKRQRHQQYNQWLRQNIAQFSWGSGGCVTYYKDDAGHHPFLFPGDIRTFKKQREELGLDAYELYQRTDGVLRSV